MDFTVNTHRLLALYHSASPSQRDEGMNWYRYAWYFTLATAQEFDFTSTQVAAVIAVTSPRQGWGVNKDTAYTLCSYHARGLSFERACLDPLVRGFSTNLAKAWRILEGENPSDVVSGPKVTAFFHNICGEQDLVTLDTHAMNAWAGDPTGKAYPAKVREQMRADYVDCATLVGVAPSEFQAVVWVVWRAQVLSAATVAHHDKSVVEQLS